MSLKTVADADAAAEQRSSAVSSVTVRRAALIMAEWSRVKQR